MPVELKVNIVKVNIFSLYECRNKNMLNIQKMHSFYLQHIRIKL
jgi:hypothetical protein